MKNSFLFLLFLLACYMVTSCGNDDNNTTTSLPPEQQLSCEIFMPEEGSVVSLAEKLIIRGEGTANVGKIVSAELKVEGILISDITSVPFYYEYSFPKDAQPGEVKIDLTVKGNFDAVASTTLTVRTEAGYRPADPIPGTMTDPRDNKEYKTIRLADQEWLAENLRYLPNGKQDFDVSTTEPKYYVILDNPMTSPGGPVALEMYGAYYNLPAALQGAIPLNPEEDGEIQGICPDGWHIPTIKEWRKLAQYVIDADMVARDATGAIDGTNIYNAAIAKALASTDMWMIPQETEDAPQPTWVGWQMEKNNATQFNGKPTGFRAVAGEYVWMDTSYSGGWWSASEGVAESTFSLVIRMYATSKEFYTTSEFNRGVGLPVRCVKNK